VRFELGIDRINPTESFATPFSCWPVILTIYNLPRGICRSSCFYLYSYLPPGI
jgi:hypothetical protein